MTSSSANGVWTVVSVTDQEKPTASTGMRFRLKLSRPQDTAHVAGSSESSFPKEEQCNDKLQGAADHDEKGVGSDQELFEFSCPVTSCGRKFPSLKSVHGHLRSHPERTYRGSKPPPSTDSDKQRHLQHLDLPKWSLKRKRGSSGIIQNVDSEIWEAASTLVAMKRASSGPIEEVQEYACKDLVSTVLKSEKKNLKVANFVPESNCLPSTLNSECEMKPPFIPEKKGSYECTACNKCFDTYQALGGHKSSCNKTKIKMGANTVEATDKAGPTTVAGHKCRVCDEVFATGPALGGHMRKHQPLVVPPPIQVIEGPSDGLRDFDLNVEPAPED